MKKFTFLLTLLGLSASSAFAGVFKPSTDSETHVYAIKNATQTNYFCSLNGANIGSTSNIGSVAYFKVENGESGQYYLYCLNNNKYVTFTETTNSETGVTTYSNITFTDAKANAKQWKIKLEANQKERYDIFPSTITDETSGSSWNWVGGVGNNLGFYGANDGNSSWTFVEAIEGTHTFDYVFGGKTRFTKTTVASIVGSDKSAAPASDVRYTSVGSMTPANIVASTTKYTVNLVEDLPFPTSTDYANAKWLIIDMHNNDHPLGGTKNYVWTYDAVGDHNHNVILPITDLKTANYTDNMLWCFIGNVFDGFKIYNKVAGESYTLRKTNTTTNPEDETKGNAACVMSTENTNNVFKVYPSTVSNLITGNTFCLKLDDDAYYVNTQKPEDEANPYTNKVLQGWKNADGGSTCRVFVPGSAIIDNALTNYRKVYTKAEGALTNAVGANSYLETSNNYNNFVTIYDAIQNNTATVEQINAFKEVKNNINTAAANETTIEAGKNYRLYNAKDKKYLFIKLYNGTKTQFNNKNVMSTKADKGNSVLSVVTFEKDGETGRFRMMMGGKTLGKRVGNDEPILLEDATSGNKGSYRVDHVGTTFRFYDQTSNVSDRSYLHCNNQNDSNDSNLCGWDAPLTNINPSLWYVVPATTAEIDMNTVGDKSYATAYLPYAISNVEGAEVYTGTLNTTNDALDMTQIQGGIPANNGVVLVGAANAKATLTLGESTADIESNSLVGTNLYIPFTTEAPRGNYLVFGKNEGNVGFYVPSAKVTSIPASKAYLNKPASSSIVMNFGGNTTGVNTVVLGENGVNAPVFDLSGRRVVAPVKGGVYIQNGKKFIK